MGYDDLGTRMKMYEAVNEYKLIRRTPVIIRIDGKAFHTFTKGLVRPFDPVVTEAMHATTKYLCDNIQNCILGYTQSDEISLLLTDYKTYKTDAWFDNKIQKITSISAAMATQWFNKTFIELAEKRRNELSDKEPVTLNIEEDWWVPGTKSNDVYKSKYFNALFDARCFNLNVEEVNNYFMWRQIDCYRNAINTFARSKFSHSQMRGMKLQMVKDELKKQFDIDVETAIPECILYGQTFHKHFTYHEVIPNIRNFKKYPMDVSIAKIELMFDEDRLESMINI